MLRSSRTVVGRLVAASRQFAVLVLAGSTLLSCGDGGSSHDPADPIDPTWSPSVTFASIEKPNARGYLDRRGLIHAHSYYSHDACDNEPVKNGMRDEVCFDDFRRGMCQTKHDFIMLTDHPSDFHLAEFPDSLLYRADRGDELVMRNGRPVASRAGCDDGHTTMILAGSESSVVMPVGLEQHVSDTAAGRDAVYGSQSSDAADTMRANGAVILVAHTEGWTAQQLIDRNIDGFEMYNIHANLMLPQATGTAIRLLFRLGQNDPALAHPDLALLYLIAEDPRYLTTWGQVLSSGKKIVTTQGTDCHRNSFPVPMQDGERVDSYRRLMLWFSNHILVRPRADGEWDDQELKAALKAGRLYGAFETFGYPKGFDFHAEAGSRVAEMGDDIDLAANPTLKVGMPVVRGLDPSKEPPLLEARILRATSAGFDEVASGDGDIAYTPTITGAYRAEIRIVPTHLREFLNGDADTLLAHDYPWIYSNAIYVR